MATITKSEIKQWNPDSMVLGGVNYGALGGDTVELAAKYEVEEIMAANSKTVIKRLYGKADASLKFDCLEINLSKLSSILTLDAEGNFGLATEPVEVSCTLTIKRGDSTYTLTGTVEFAPDFMMGLTVNKVAQPSVTVNFTPNSEGALFKLVEAS